MASYVQKRVSLSDPVPAAAPKTIEVINAIEVEILDFSGESFVRIGGDQQADDRPVRREVICVDDFDQLQFHTDGEDIDGWIEYEVRDFSIRADYGGGAAISPEGVEQLTGDLAPGETIPAGESVEADVGGMEGVDILRSRSRFSGMGSASHDDTTAGGAGSLRDRVVDPDRPDVQYVFGSGTPAVIAIETDAGGGQTVLSTADLSVPTPDVTRGGSIDYDPATETIFFAARDHLNSELVVGIIDASDPSSLSVSTTQVLSFGPNNNGDHDFSSLVILPNLGADYVVALGGQAAGVSGFFVLLDVDTSSPSITTGLTLTGIQFSWVRPAGGNKILADLAGQVTLYEVVGSSNLNFLSQTPDLGFADEPLATDPDRELWAKTRGDDVTGFGSNGALTIGTWEGDNVRVLAQLTATDDGTDVSQGNVIDFNPETGDMVVFGNSSGDVVRLTVSLNGTLSLGAVWTVNPSGVGGSQKGRWMPNADGGPYVSFGDGSDSELISETVHGVLLELIPLLSDGSPASTGVVSLFPYVDAELLLDLDLVGETDVRVKATNFGPETATIDYVELFREVV